MMVLKTYSSGHCDFCRPVADDGMRWLLFVCDCVLRRKADRMTLPRKALYRFGAENRHTCTAGHLELVRAKVLHITVALRSIDASIKGKSPVLQETKRHPDSLVVPMSDSIYILVSTIESFTYLVCPYVPEE